MRKLINQSAVEMMLLKIKVTTYCIRYSRYLITMKEKPTRFPDTASLTLLKPQINAVTAYL